MGFASEFGVGLDQFPHAVFFAVTAAVRTTTLVCGSQSRLKLFTEHYSKHLLNSLGAPTKHVTSYVLRKVVLNSGDLTELHSRSVLADHVVAKTDSPSSASTRSYPFYLSPDSTTASSRRMLLG